MPMDIDATLIERNTAATEDVGPLQASVPANRPTVAATPLNPWLCTVEGSAARRIVEAVRHRMDTDGPPRQRKRRANDARTFAALIDMVVANLVRLHLELPESTSVDDAIAGRHWINVSLSPRRLTRDGRGRYGRSPISLRLLPEHVHLLEHLGFLILDKAPRWEGAYRTSRVRAGPELVTLIEAHRPELGDLTRHRVSDSDGTDREETIELRQKAVRLAEWSNEPQSERIDYSDNERTRAWRREMTRINDALASADIAFASTGLIDVPARGIAVGDRYLRRVFNNGRFDHGGRLYGGFWQVLPRELRPGLRIGGEPVVLLDYRSMFLQLLYALKARMQPPLDGDLYEGIDPIDGWPDDPAQTAMMRDSIKRNVNALLFARARPAGRKPRLVKGTRSALSKGVDGAELERRIKVRHPEIAEWIGTDVGYELMHHESEIMVRILLRCLDQGVIILPLHDGLMVAESQWMAAREAMHAAFYSYTGGMFECVEGPVQLAP